MLQITAYQATPNCQNNFEFILKQHDSKSIKVIEIAYCAGVRNESDDQ